MSAQLRSRESSYLTYSLTVTAGLPATLTAPHSKILRAFGSHPKAQSGDLKLAGLGELVLIVQRASLSCGDVSLRQLDAISLNVVTAEMDAWDKAWSVVLHQSTLLAIACVYESS